MLREVGLGYLRLGQPATELSGGEAQRIKLATELQRAQRGDDALRPRRADHRPASRPTSNELMTQLDGLVECRQHASSSSSTTCSVVAASDWVIDIGPGAGDEGGTVVASGPPADVAKAQDSRTAPFLASASQPMTRLRREPQRRI